MKEIAVIHIGERNADETVSLLGEDVLVHYCATSGDAERAKQLIAEYDGKVDCIALDGFPSMLQLGSAQRPHEVGSTLPGLAKQSPIVDGSGIRGGLERWAVILADRAQPGIFAEKQTLFAPGLNHSGITQALLRRSKAVRYADPVIYFGLPDFPFVGSQRTLEQAAPRTLDELKDTSFRRLRPVAGEPGHERIRRTIPVGRRDRWRYRRYPPLCA